MSQIITLRVSDILYKQLERVAKLSHQATEAIIVQSLTHTLKR